MRRNRRPAQGAVSLERRIGLGGGRRAFAAELMLDGRLISNCALIKSKFQRNFGDVHGGVVTMGKRIEVPS